jgi:hypothetical protein
VGSGHATGDVRLRHVPRSWEARASCTSRLTVPPSRRPHLLVANARPGRGTWQCQMRPGPQSHLGRTPAHPPEPQGRDLPRQEVALSPHVTPRMSVPARLESFRAGAKTGSALGLGVFASRGFLIEENSRTADNTSEQEGVWVREVQGDPFCSRRSGALRGGLRTQCSRAFDSAVE